MILGICLLAFLIFVNKALRGTPYEGKSLGCGACEPQALRDGSSSKKAS